jgi:integrase
MKVNRFGKAEILTPEQISSLFGSGFVNSRDRALFGICLYAAADRLLREACLKLEIEGVSTHSFRRTALTHMSDSGVPLRHIQAISGHRTLAALERYLGVTDQQKQRAISTLDF